MLQTSKMTKLMLLTLNHLEVATQPLNSYGSSKDVLFSAELYCITLFKMASSLKQLTILHDACH